MVGMYSDLRVHLMNIIINKCVHGLFIVTLKYFQLYGTVEFNNGLVPGYFG